jgi:hypothetical protein
MKQFLLSVSLLIGAAVNAQDCSDLFISEYVEGWSNNKALEIYNPTNQSIDLSAYLVQRYSNGSTSAGTQQSVQLSGTIEAYGTYVAVIDKRDPMGQGQEAPVWDSLQAKADGFYCPDYNVSNALYFNGNDAVVLAKGSVTDLANVVAVDIFGKIGEDPDLGNEYTGWTSDFPFVGAGAVITTDHSMIRKRTVLEGETNPQISFFDPLLEYDSIPAVVTDQGTGNLEGNWASLGTHLCDCDPESSVKKEVLSEILIYPNPSENGEFTISVESGIEKIEVVNTLGQSVLNKKNLDAVSTINIGSKTGVYFVKIETEDGRVSSRRVIIK